jgi:N-acetylmuramoyl-L-alanine amidase
MVAVAWVIRHRSERSGWPDSVALVCLQPKQFSCWNSSDPNRAKMMLAGHDTPMFNEAMFAAYGTLTAKLSDPTGGADHYHTSGCNPSWDDGMELVTIVGSHEFYRRA